MSQNESDDPVDRTNNNIQADSKEWRKNKQFAA